MKTKSMTLITLSLIAMGMESVGFASEVQSSQTKEKVAVVTEDAKAGTRAVAQEEPIEKKRVPYHTGVKGNR